MMSDTFKLTQRTSLALLVLNVVGAVVYVMRSTRGWVIPEEHGSIPVTGEPFAWAGATLPVITVFFLLNLTWGALILRYRQWQSGRIWLGTLLPWLIAIVIDFKHHAS